MSQTLSLGPDTVAEDQSLLDGLGQTELSSPVPGSDYVHGKCIHHHPKITGITSKISTLKDATHLKDDIVQLKDPGVTSDNILIMESLNPLVGGQRISIRLTCQTYSASHLTRN